MAKDGDQWEKAAKRVLRTALARHDMRQTDLAARLAEDGSAVSLMAIRNKLSRGTFTAAFLLRCLDAIGCATIDLGDARVPKAREKQVD